MGPSVLEKKKMRLHFVAEKLISLKVRGPVKFNY